MKKRLFCLLLALVMVACVINVTVVTADDTEQKSLLTKTAEWDDGEKQDLTITLTSEDASGRLKGKVLFLGTLCNRHNLDVTKLKTALGITAMYADVDYYLFQTPKDTCEATASFKGTIKKTNKTNYADSIKAIENDALFKESGLLGESMHHTIYDFANVINDVAAKTDYDYIVMEFDGFLLGEYNVGTSASPKGADIDQKYTDALDAAAKVIKGYYAKDRVLWIVPAKGSNGTNMYYDGKFDGTGVSGTNSDKIQTSIREITKLLAPEDLDSNGKVKSGKLSTQTTLYSRITEKDASKKIWTTYGTSDEISDLLDRRFGGVKYKKVVITDTVNDGFIIDGVHGYIFNEETSKWEDAGTKFSHDWSKGKTTVNGTFIVKDLPHTLVKMTLDAHVDNDNDPFKDAVGHTAETNKGKATAKYYNTDGDTPRDTYEAPSPKLKRVDCEITTKIVNGTLKYKTNASQEKTLNDEDKVTVKDHSGLETENDVTFNYSPDLYYELDYIKIDGEKLSDTDLTSHSTSYLFEDVDANHSIEVAYKLPNVTVKFNTHGATTETPEDQVIGKGTKATKPSAPEKPGYTFTKWTTDEQGTSEFDFDNTGVTEDITLHAQYTEDDVTIDYVATKGGKVKLVGETETGSSKEETIKADNGTAKGAVAVADEGYTFSEWANSSESETYGTEETFVPSKDNDTDVYVPATYYAFFTINNYPVTFNMHGHGTNPGKQDVDYGDYAEEPSPEPTSDNYDFGGWYTDGTFIKKFDFDGTAITKATEIHALWTEKKATVNYVANNGGSVDVSTEKVDVISGNHNGSTAAPDEHYHFVNWTDKNGAEVGTDLYFKPSANETTGLYEDATYYANFEIDTVPFKFDNMGHGTKPSDQDVNYGSKAVEPQALTEEGYEFDGWYVDNTFSAPYNFNNAVTAETTVFAKWKVKVNYIDYEGPKSGSDEDYIEIGDTPSDDVAEPEGYDFDGFYTDPDYKTPFDPSKPLSEPTNIYVKWNEKTAVLHYVIGEGAKSDDSLEDTMKYTKSAKIADKSVKKEGAILKGWAINSENAASGIVDYAIGDTYKQANVVPAEGYVYAVWEIPEQTGDVASNAIVWIATAFLAILGLALILFFRKKASKENN